MSDEVTIANLALSKLGEDDQLTDLADDKASARAIRAVWVPVRRFCLRKGKFNFSLFRDELAAQASSSPSWRSPYPYQYRFPLHADALRLVEIIEPASVVENYRLEGGAILADTVGPVWARCVHDVPETGLWDDLFVEAFASRLAFQVSDRITGDRGRKADAMASYRAAIKEAAGVDAKEDPPEDAYDSSWVAARFGV